MRVLLATSPVTVYGSGIVRPILPLGLMYLASYVKSKNRKVEVEIFDPLALGIERVVRHRGGRRYGLSAIKIKKFVSRYRPDVVGISCMYTAYEEDVAEMADLIKSVDHNIRVVVGGAHVSIDPLGIMKKIRSIDVAVFGEGEETFNELLTKDLTQVSGIVFRLGGKMIKNNKRDLIANLDTIPFPAWEMIDRKMYDMGSVFNMRRPIFEIVSSRGCPNHCLYCSIHSLWEHHWRGRSAVNVVDEVEYYLQRFGAKEFAFMDDSMSVDRKRMNQICDEIIKRNLNIKWTTPNGIAHWTLDKDLIKKMKKAGCYRITFGIESGDAETRRWVGKPFDLDQAAELTKYANSLGMWTLATNIIGFPYDTRKKIEATLEYALKSEVDLAFFYVLGPRPGTVIYEIFKKEGWLMKNRKMLFSENVACRTRYFSGKEIVSLQKEMYSKFLKKRWLNPKAIIRLLGKIRSTEDFWYLIKMTGRGVKLLTGLVTSNRGITSKTLRV